MASIVIGSGVLGVGFQVAVFYVVIVYARHFSSGETVNLIGQQLDPRSSIGLLLGGSAVMVVLLLFSAFCIYYSRRNILSMAREYEEFCAKRVFQLLDEGGDLFPTKDDSVAGESYLFRLVRSDSRFAGRVLRKLLSLVVPAATLIAAIAVLFYLEVTLTLVIAGLGVGFLFYQYRVSLEAAKHSMRFEKLGSASSAEYRALIEHYKHQPRGGRNRELAERLFANGPIRKQLDAFESRLRAVEKSRLVSGIFMAVVVGLIVIVMGVNIIREGAGWGRLLVYVVALRFAMVSLQNVFSAITSINRFYPQVGRYFAFVRSFTRQDAGQYPLRDVYTLELEGKTTADTLAGSVQHREILRGTRIAFVTSLELNRYTLPGLVNSLLGSDQAAACSVLYTSRYASIDHSRPTTSLRQALGLSAEATWEDLRGWFPDENSWERARTQVPKNLDKTMSPKSWQKVDPALKFVLSLVSAKMEGCSWIFIQSEGLRRLGPDAARFYLSLFTDAVSVVVHNRDLSLVGSFDEEAVAVADEQELLGLGSPDWFATVRDEVSELIGGGKRKGGEGMQGDTLDDELLD